MKLYDMNYMKKLKMKMLLVLLVVSVNMTQAILNEEVEMYQLQSIDT